MGEFHILQIRSHVFSFLFFPTISTVEEANDRLVKANKTSTNELKKTLKNLELQIQAYNFDHFANGLYLLELNSFRRVNDVAVRKKSKSID